MTELPVLKLDSPEFKVSLVGLLNGLERDVTRTRGLASEKCPQGERQSRKSDARGSMLDECSDEYSTYPQLHNRPPTWPLCFDIRNPSRPPLRGPDRHG